MQNLVDKITAHRCQMHSSPIEYLCIDQVCQHKFRGMCSLCLERGQSSDNYSIQNISQFLAKQKLCRDAKKQALQEKLRFCFTLVSEENRKKLFSLESRIQENIGLIQGDAEVEHIYSLCKSISFTPNQIEHLGRLVSQYVKISDTSEFVAAEEDFTQCQEYQLARQDTLSYLKQSEQSTNGHQVNIQSDTNELQTDTKTLQMDPDMKWKCLNQKKSSGNGFHLVYKIDLGFIITSIKFNHDDTQLIIGAHQQLRLVTFYKDRLKLNNQTTMLAKNRQIINTVWCNHDSTMLAAASDANDSVAMYQNLAPNKWVIKRVIKPIQNTQPQSQISFASIDNKFRIIAITGSSRKTVSIYSLVWDRWKLIKIIAVATYGSQVQFRDDYKLMIINTNQMLIYNMQNGELKYEELDYMPQVNLGTGKFCINKPANMIVDGDNYGKITVWRQGRVTRCWNSHPSEITSILFNNESNLLVSVCELEVKIWKQDLKRSNWKFSQKINIKQKQTTNEIALSSDSRTLLLTGSNRGTVCVYKMK